MLNKIMNQLVTLRQNDQTNNLIAVPLEKEGSKMSILGLTWKDFQGLSWIFEEEFE